MIKYRHTKDIIILFNNISGSLSKIAFAIEGLIYYICYIYYSMNTTIQISQEMKEKIASFGSKNETYEQILERVYALAVKTQLREFLMSSENSIPIEEAIKEAKKLWPKSK